MARPRLLDARLVEHAKRLAAQAHSFDDLRCAQAVLLPAILGATLEQTATALGVGRATVGRCQAKVRKRLSHPAELDPEWGGRRRAAMSVEEECEFLEPWAESAADGGMLIVAPLRAALAQRLGRPITHSVVCRLLERHGWRKVAPDTRHPKSNPLTQEQWKETACVEVTYPCYWCPQPMLLVSI
jgi:transposase